MSSKIASRTFPSLEKKALLFQPHYPCIANGILTRWVLAIHYKPQWAHISIDTPVLESRKYPYRAFLMFVDNGNNKPGGWWTNEPYPSPLWTPLTENLTTSPAFKLHLDDARGRFQDLEKLIREGKLKPR